MKKPFIPSGFLFVLLALSFHLNAQIINTIAGTGTGAFFGDGMPATAAEINAPNGLFTDKEGNLYFADFMNQRIRRVDPWGTITTVAGNGSTGYSGDNGPATAASMNHPSDVAVDAQGHIAFADFNNNRVRVIMSGVITTIAGNGTPSSTGDGGLATAATLIPCGVYYDTSGKLLVAEQTKVRVVSKTGIINTVAGTGITGYSGDGGPATNAQFSYINFISVDASNNLYISDNGNHCIRKVNSAGIVTTIAGNGTIGYSGDGGPATNAQLCFPAGAIVDTFGNIFIADAMNHRIRKINTAGIISTYAGTGSAFYSGDGGLAIAADINFPQDVAMDVNGNLILGDYYNDRIRKITTIYKPYFSSASHASSLCINSTANPINSLLAVIDTGIGRTETWTVKSLPVHGTLNGFSASAIYTGGVLTPSGLTYSPALGYSGNDSFTVKVSDGVDSDTVKIYTTVADCALRAAALSNAGQIVAAPNPSGGLFSLYVGSDNSQAADIVVTNFLGRRVKEFTIPTNRNIEINLNEPSGIYFIISSTRDGIGKTKILIEK